jgi:putative spermidine/putrescine transport system permease protein
MIARTKMPWLLLPLVICFGAFFAAPMAVVLLASLLTEGGELSSANYLRILIDQYHWNVLAVTLRISLITTLACVLLGYPLAYYLVRVTRWRHWRRICLIIVILPLFTSNVVRSFGWMVLLGRKGLVNDAMIWAGLWDAPVRFLGTETGIVIGLTYILLPFMVLSIGNVLAAIDPALENASADLFAGPAAAFLHVVLPLTLPGLLSGMIMVFTLAVSAYVTPALLSGGRVVVFPILIFQQYSVVFDFNYGAALSITLLVIVLMLVMVASAMLRGGGAQQ